jgi:hypothetical protein
VKNHDITPKNHIFSNFRGVRPPLNPPLHLTKYNNMNHSSQQPQHLTKHNNMKHSSQKPQHLTKHNNMNHSSQQPQQLTKHNNMNSPLNNHNISPSTTT